jgi:hypothetical protein
LSTDLAERTHADSRARRQGTEFDLYQDNLYGSFLLVPVAY